MLELKAKIREKIGKNLGILRREGVLPAVVYGYQQKNEALELDYKEFEMAYRETGESALIQLKIGDKDKTVLIRDVQRDPVSGEFIHADFYAVREDEPLKIIMPLTIVGDEEAPAVKELGGYIGRYIHEVEIEALPKDLPKELVVNTSGLKNFEDKVFIKDIVLPPGVKIIANPDEVIASAEAPITEEEIKEELAAPAEEKVEEVEVEEKGKKEEETGEAGQKRGS